VPIYEYKCKDCGFVSEFLEKAGTAKKHTCQKCKSSNLQKLLSGFSVGLGKSAEQTCESCPDGSCSGNSCMSGTCPYN
jgi:putative FmdB family regulatory protein